MTERKTRPKDNRRDGPWPPLVTGASHVRVRQLGVPSPEKETDPQRIVEHLRSEGHPHDFFSCVAQRDAVRDYYKNHKAAETRMQELLDSGEVEYVWQASQDDRDCPLCRSRNGKIFSLLDPPSGGHPGMKPGCRCRMEAVPAAGLPDRLLRRRSETG